MRSTHRKRRAPAPPAVLDASQHDARRLGVASLDAAPSAWLGPQRRQTRTVQAKELRSSSLVRIGARRRSGGQQRGNKLPDRNTRLEVGGAGRYQHRPYACANVRDNREPALRAR